MVRGLQRSVSFVEEPESLRVPQRRHPFREPRAAIENEAHRSGVYTRPLP